MPWLRLNLSESPLRERFGGGESPTSRFTRHSGTARSAAVSSLRGVPSLQAAQLSEGEYRASRRQRLLYAAPQLHLALLELLLRLTLAPSTLELAPEMTAGDEADGANDETRDRIEVDESRRATLPVRSSARLNVLLLLRRHLSHPANRTILDPLIEG